MMVVAHVLQTAVYHIVSDDARTFLLRTFGAIFDPYSNQKQTYESDFRLRRVNIPLS